MAGRDAIYYFLCVHFQDPDVVLFVKGEPEARFSDGGVPTCLLVAAHKSNANASVSVAPPDLVLFECPAMSQGLPRPCTPLLFVLGWDRPGVGDACIA